ncbi:MAG TPA: riboflavin kinase [Candidatus Dojkabacteria bacterium]|jgi:riboflavin kinase/FMN adenylyltransferase
MQNHKSPSNKLIIRGKVLRGSGDGTKLGFPTLNVELTSELEIEFGVYAARVYIKNDLYEGVLHYGPRLVFDESNPQLEVHLFQFSENVYGENVVVEILDFIRPTKNFDSLEPLIEQMSKDCEDAQKILDEDF